MSWQLVYSKQAQKDAKKLSAAGLKEKAQDLLLVIANDPFQNPPSYEKLVGLPLKSLTLNLILERTDQVKFFTNMRLVFTALGISAADYDWFVSDIETNYQGADFTEEDRWIKGETLQNFVDENDVQFIWAVFSAVPKGFRCNVTAIPYIYNNPNYWNGIETHPQLPGALFEIACWDSSATILVGLPPALEENFKQAYSDACSLVSVAR